MDARSPRRVLVVYDGTVPARRALARATELAAGGEVHVINVMPYPAEPGAAEQRALQATLLRQACEALGGDAEQNVTIAAEGDAAIEVLAAAEGIGADVVVSALDRARFPHRAGSIADALVRRAPCDVYIVHAHREPPPG